MAANRLDSLGDRHVAIGHRPLGNRLRGQLLLQLIPQVDALEEEAGLVGARQSVRQGARQRRIHVEVSVDEGRRDQPVRGVDLLPGLGLQRRLHGNDAPVLHADVHADAPIGQIGAAHDQVHRHVVSPLLRFA